MKTKTLFAAALIVCSSAALAQQVPPVESPPAATQAAPGTEPPPDIVTGPGPGRRPRPVTAPGPVVPFQLGSFLVYPEVVVTELSDDNVFSTHSDRVRDDALILTPSVWVQSNWRRHYLAFNASGDFTRYDTQTTESTDDYRASGEGRFDFSADANVYGGLRVAREHEDRESPEGRNGLEPTRYKLARLYAGAFRKFGRLYLRAGVNALKLDFNDVPFLTGSGVIAIINNDDRDRTQAGAGLRVGYQLTPRLLPFVQFSNDNRRYVSSVDDLGFDRDSNGKRLIAGLRTFSPGVYKLEVFAGLMRQDYEDPRLADVSKPSFGGNLVWETREGATVSASVDRTIEETTVFVGGTPIFPASSYVNTYGQVDVRRFFTPRFLAYVFGSASRADYQGIRRVDDYVTTGFGMLYRWSKWCYVDATYQYRKLYSEVPSEDFRRNQIFVRLAFPLSK